METIINKVQQLQFELMRIATFNQFDGNRVVNDLETFVDLWKSVIMDRPDLIKLRDVEHGGWNVDTVYIIPSGVNDKLLESLAWKWKASSVEWINGGGFSGEETLGISGRIMILKVWWD
jgi:hypothetical protein